MIFYYVRHGDPIYDPDSLTQLGHTQAKALAPRFAVYGLDEIYASTSTRARQTAEPTCKLLRKEAELCDFANEAYAWTEITAQNENGRPSWLFQNKLYIQKLRDPSVIAMGKEWYKHPHFNTLPKLEYGVKRIEDATDAFFEKLGFKHLREENGYVLAGRTPPKRVALFAHQGFGLSFLSSLTDIPYPLFASSFDISHSSVTAIYFNENQEIIYPKILQLSNDSHLYKEGVNCKYNNTLEI